MQLYGPVRDRYHDFAAYTRDASPCFEQWALGVADDREVLEMVGALPPVKQQPNLVFAAARWHGAPAPATYAVLREHLLGSWPAIRATVLARSTQTNEVGRLATVVPALAELQASAGGRPLALLEVGASAGLCLYPDRFAYQWRTRSGEVTLTTHDRPGAPTLVCDVTGPAPLPTEPVQVSWRRGVDLHPLNVLDDEDMAWLRTLVWPEEAGRRTRLDEAIEVARSDPPHVQQGDLLAALPSLVAQAPSDATLVVFHSAVVAYLEPGDRDLFQATMSDLVARGACHWVSNEGYDVLPAVTATAPVGCEDLPTFVLGVDGQAVAWTHGHGAHLTWW